MDLILDVLMTALDLGHLTEWIALVLGAGLFCSACWAGATYLATRRMR